MRSLNYMTKQGDRLDLLAHEFYGSIQGISRIVDANPKVPVYPVFEAGVILTIPIIDDNQTVESVLLPPWKRS